MLHLAFSLLLLQTSQPPSKPLGKFDQGKAASSQTLHSVGVRGAIDGGGYAASAAAKTQTELYRQLAALQLSVTRSLWKSSLPCPQAIPALEKQVQATAASAKRQLLGLAYEANGQLEAAAEQFRLASAQLQDDASQYLYGSALLLIGDQQRAQSAFANGNSSLLATGRASALFQSGEFDQALQLFLQSRAYNFVAVAVTSATPTAITDAIKQLAASRDAPYALACARLAANETDTGVIESELKQAIARDPTLAGAHFRLAASYAARADTPAAITEYNTALTLDPDLADAHYRLSQLLMREGNVPAAKAHLRLHQQLRSRRQAEIESGRIPFRFPGLPSPSGCATLLAR